VPVFETPASHPPAVTHASARIIALPLQHTRPSTVRRSRVVSARARLAIGWYDRPQVRWQIADAVLRELLPA
jgi:hypothetical protein